MSVAEHKQHPPTGPVRVAVITVSDTRTESTDVGGKLIQELCLGAGHTVVSRDIVPDEPTRVAAALEALAGAGAASEAAEVVLLTGGTGVARRDTTVEAVTGRFDKTLDGFGELFRMLSWQEIGAAAMLSRATAGIIWGQTGGLAVFLMPGSPAAVRLAMERLILPELGHIISLLRR